MARHPRKASKPLSRQPAPLRQNLELLESRTVLSPCVPNLLGDFDGLAGKLGSPPAMPDAEVTFFGGDWNDDFAKFPDATDANLYGGDGDDTLSTTPGTGGGPTLGGGGDTLVTPVGGQATLFGGDGNDTIVPSPGPDITLFGGDGNDSLTVSGPATNVTIFGGDGNDSLTVSGGTDVTVFGGDGNDTYVPPPGGDVTVFGGIGDDTIAVGGSGSDVTVFGWDADDGFVAAPTRGPAAGSGNSAGQTTVFVDFDSGTEPGEWVYTPAERAAVLGRLRETFADFRFEFVSAPPASGPFIHVGFNAGPAGGSSSELDFGNRDPGGEATVNVNGLLGRPGGVPLDSASVTAVSATIAAHEIGHLLGLRHADAFGPIGTGIYESPNRADLGYRPQYEPGDASEMPLHIMGSPRSIGVSLAAAAGPTYFGEREAIKLSFAQSGLTVGEQDLPQLESGARFLGALPELAVPNTLRPGAAHYGDTFDVGAIAVAGEITLRPDGHSENDTYAFFGRAGDIVNMEAISASRVPLTGNPIDSVLRVFDSSGRQIAWNDDGFESTDSEIIDLHIPADGLYYVMVDTYTPNGITDSDIGTYELFISRFASTPGPAGPVAGPVADPPVVGPVLSAEDAPSTPAADMPAKSEPETPAGVWLPPAPEAKPAPTDSGPSVAPKPDPAIADPVRIETGVDASKTDDLQAAPSTEDGADSKGLEDDLSLSMKLSPG
ncbi:MAG TPA: hypothetical protein VKE74_19940 [Gemmataceae bacterium]|nr:hypothetical protein [Gemmataceae bacterium]